MTGTIWIRPIGNMGNRALQYLAAHGIAQHAPEATIQNIHLPEWGTGTACAEPAAENSIATGIAGFHLDVAGLADCLRRGVVETIKIEGYPYNLANFPSRAAARDLIPRQPATGATGFGADSLVCSVRAAEVLDNVHPDYLLLPPAYYKMLAERTGLGLVFFGQLGDDPYSDSLRREFPDAGFIPSVSPTYDFEMLRNSVNIALSVSTFAWAAAWLSEAARIFLPVCGIFSPVQLPRMMFLPLQDPAYEFFLLPFSKAANVHQSPIHFALAQTSLAQNAAPISAAALTTILARVGRLLGRPPLLTGFDPAFYLQAYPDVAELVANGSLPSALHHYYHAGFREGRQPMPFDAFHYANAYPDAAMAIAQGYYADPIHHYQLLGQALGYQPLP